MRGDREVVAEYAAEIVNLAAGKNLALFIWALMLAGNELSEARLKYLRRQ